MGWRVKRSRKASKVAGYKKQKSDWGGELKEAEKRARWRITRSRKASGVAGYKKQKSEQGGGLEEAEKRAVEEGL